MSINIWADPWLPRSNTRRPITPRNGSVLRVVDLINPITNTWDSQLVRETFCDEYADLILAIPLRENQRDFIAWHADPKGRFSVKSAYAVGVRRRDQANLHDQSMSNQANAATVWSKIWGLQVTNKIKMFLWRFTYNSLPVQTKLARKGVKRVDT